MICPYHLREMTPHPERVPEFSNLLDMKSRLVLRCPVARCFAVALAEQPAERRVCTRCRRKLKHDQLSDHRCSRCSRTVRAADRLKARRRRNHNHAQASLTRKKRSAQQRVGRHSYVHGPS